MFSPQPNSYQNTVEGTWGEFRTPTGRVAFLLTKARLGTQGADNERRLTAHLRPVREVLSADKLDFNQLLQRDLDDHRVAEGLIPYLLKPKATGPAFFPPIMALLLPFDAGSPADHFPAESEHRVVDDGGVRFQQIEFGQAYRVQRLADASGNHHQIKLGRLSWNDEFARLVVIDGQHRAMALLAIDRTANAQWGTGAGNQYRHFYEAKVRELLREADKDFRLEQIQIPVTVCWFPDLNGTNADPHKAARKLFVDVNKEARTPSEARLTLLSDTELLNIFTRRLLNRLRQADPPMPLYAIEYDNPDKETARPVKWSVVTNLNLLKFAVARCVFGPRKYINDVTQSFGGRPSERDMNLFMRTQLDVSTLYPDTIKDGERTIQRDAIGNDLFPLSQIEPLVDRFMESWGASILHVLSALRPYAAHWRALEALKNSWVTDDSFSNLASEALFSGVGMFWTLRSSNDYFTENRERCRREKLPEPIKPDIVKAWEVIEIHKQKYTDFVARRAYEYAGKKSDADIAVANHFYDVANTHACQLGAILTVATLAFTANVKPAQLLGFTRTIVDAWNAALESRRTAAETRHFLFTHEPKSIKYPLNMLGRMDTSFAVYFRYFWLELLTLPVARTRLAGSPLEMDQLDALTAQARRNYLNYLVDEQKKALREIEGPSAKTKHIEDKASRLAGEKLAKALSHWFDMDKARAEQLVQASASAGPRPSKNEPADGDSDEPEPTVSIKQPVDDREILDELARGDED